MSTAHEEIRASLYEEKYRYVGDVLTELLIPRLDFMRHLHRAHGTIGNARVVFLCPHVYSLRNS
jgi:hypothetical protein